MPINKLSSFWSLLASHLSSGKQTYSFYIFIALRSVKTFKIALRKSNVFSQGNNKMKTSLFENGDQSFKKKKKFLLEEQYLLMVGNYFSKVFNLFKFAI